MNRKLYVELGQLASARLNCVKGIAGNAEWQERHEERLAFLVKEHMPSGSGFDNGTTLDLARSTGDRLVFCTSFHHMNESGYDGWTDHVVTIVPTFGGFSTKVSGRNRNEIKDYIADTFAIALDVEVQS